MALGTDEADLLGRGEADELAARIDAAVHVDIHVAIEEGLEPGLPCPLDRLVVLAHDETGGGFDPAACGVVGATALRTEKHRGPLDVVQGLDPAVGADGEVELPPGKPHQQRQVLGELGRFGLIGILGLAGGHEVVDVRAGEGHVQVAPAHFEHVDGGGTAGHDLDRHAVERFADHVREGRHGQGCAEAGIDGRHAKRDVLRLRRACEGERESKSARQ